MAAGDRFPRWPQASVAMPFVGIPTFLKMPAVVAEEDLEGADIAVLGIPYDEGTTSRPGARYGPRAIREASQLYTYWPSRGLTGWDIEAGQRGFYDIETGRRLLQGRRWVDAGDVAVLPTEREVTFDRITTAVEALLARKVLPVILGGDHAVTYPSLRAFGSLASPLQVLHLDSHLDFLGALDGARLTHGSPLRRAHELGFVAGIHHFGIRGLLNDEEIHREACEAGTTVVTAREARARGMEEVARCVPERTALYVTVDIDVLDPSCAPGTGTPEPGGLTYLEARALLGALVRRGALVGIDLVEVCPLYDPAGLTAQVATRLLVDTLGTALAKEGEA